MTTRQGTYKTFLQGVSQQIPQEREDGQLGEQINMLSDPVTGLRRRSGAKYYNTIPNVSAASYVQMVDIQGENYIVCIDTSTGVVKTMHFETGVITTFTDSYFTATSKKSIRSVVSRNNMFILNTEKVPTKVLTGSAGKNPNRYGYVSIRSSAFSKTFNFEISHPSLATNPTTISFTTDGGSAANATPEWVAQQFANAITTNSTLNAFFNIQRVGVTVALEVKNSSDNGLLSVESSNGSVFVYASGASRVASKSELLGTLPSMLDGYTLAVGNVGNTAYYQFSSTTKLWSEVGAYETPYTISNTPRYIRMGSSALELEVLEIKPRAAGDDDNNPLPSFIDYGFTGIGAYQSRLVLLSGSYVYMSRTKEFDIFMRTSVTELLDDDPIEVASASLSSAQFEYCLPYNKDLVLIAQTQQAVIPANSTVLTPKNAVIYPSTDVELSLAAEPKAVSRSAYYVSQLGSDYYQVGEFIPNSYTDAQYYSQNLTDHLPLYAKGVCTNIATSTTNNMAVFTSDTNEVFINQYLWQGDQRVQLAFHKWIYPYPVAHAEFRQDFLILFMVVGNDLVIGTQNVMINQLETKPAPYLDLYSYVDSPTGTLPSYILDMDFVAVVYDTLELRHQYLAFEVSGSTITTEYEGTLAVGIPYESTFTLTPPFIKDQNGVVIAGAGSTLNRLEMEFQNTGSFTVSVKDTMGTAYAGEDDTALTWSETQLGYSWVNSIGSIIIPCRTRLTSTECKVTTDGTTDLNLVTTRYVVRVNAKHRRI